MRNVTIITPVHFPSKAARPQITIYKQSILSLSKPSLPPLPIATIPSLGYSISRMISDAVSIVKGIVSVGDYLAQQGPQHVLHRVNQDLERVMPLIEEYRDCKPKHEVDQLLRTYDRLRLRADQLESELQARPVTLKLKMQKTLPRVRIAHTLSKESKRLVTSAKRSSEKARREDMRRYIQIQRRNTSPDSVAPSHRDQSDRPSQSGSLVLGNPVASQDIMASSPKGASSSEEPDAEFIVDRRIALGVCDPVERQMNGLVETKSSISPSGPSRPLSRYPTHVQVSMPVAALEILSPGISQYLFARPEATDGDQEPLVVWVSPSYDTILEDSSQQSALAAVHETGEDEDLPLCGTTIVPV
ncbi:hypothetical protein OBBRIDRAFT_835190 [Obba rivulosa]|uniref:Uncharacterized protein n=1 Tax=Obba rivulosa TaxID=1052685 RepID=A0A8E2DNK8_9APHY|nr:hypothetical protein OBBRIDRAFT_835190 [Obba rivulosa]